MNKSAMIRARVDPNLKDEDVRIPNAVTLRTFGETDADENVVHCENAQDMFARLGI